MSLVRSHPSSASKNNLRMVAAEVRMRRKLKRLLKQDAAPRRANARLLAEIEGTLGAEEVMHGSRARGLYRLVRATIFDRKVRHKLKWLSCALAAPFVGRDRFRKLYTSSLTRAAARPLSRFQASGRR
jgi:hypothetical protein